MSSESHPLQNEWCFWEHRKGGSNYGSYGNSLTKIGTFNTAEGFWQYLNAYPLPAKLFSAKPRVKFTDREVEGVSLFKQGIRPEWEDVANLKGGEWCFRRTLSPSALNWYWETLLMGLIGETIDWADEITGMRLVNKSKGERAVYRIEVWFRSQDLNTREKLKERLLDVLNNTEGGEDVSTEDFSYRAHSEAITHHVGSGRGGGRR